MRFKRRESAKYQRTQWRNQRIEAKKWNFDKRSGNNSKGKLRFKTITSNFRIKKVREWKTTCWTKLKNSKFRIWNSWIIRKSNYNKVR